MVAIASAKKDLEDLLKNVDYSKFDNGYVPTKFALKFILFIKLVNGSLGEENTSPLFHYDMLDTITESTQNLFVCFRGGAKTSVIHEYMILYIALYGEVDGFGTVDVGMYVGDTMENGVKSLRQNLEFRWEHSEFLRKYVPHAKFTDVRWEFKNADGKMFCVRGFGASTGVRGFKEYGKRPTWCGFDDLLSDKNADSETIVLDIKKVLYRAARQCLHPTKRMMNWTGTPFNKSDPLYEAAESPSWNTRVYPICENYPCEEAEFKGAWENRFPYSFVASEYTSLVGSGELASFDQELMLRITSDADRIVKDDDIVWYSRKNVLLNKSAYNFYITTDFSVSEEDSADFSVISVWAYNNNNDWLLVDGVCKKMEMDETLKELFRLVGMYKPLEVGIEISGQQKGFIPWIKSEMLLKNTFFNIAKQFDSKKEGIRPTTKKISRFILFAPKIRAKKVMLPEELKGTEYMNEALEEIKYVTKKGFKSKNDDVLDTWSMLSEIEPFAPSEEVPVDYTEDESGKFAHFPPDDDFEDGVNSTVF